MSGIDGVIARVGEIEQRIVSLDPVSRAAETAATAAAGETGAAGEATFAGVLEAAKAAASAAEPAAGADTASSSGGTSQADLVSALQTLFTANGNSTAPGGAAASATSLQNLIGMLG